MSDQTSSEPASLSSSSLPSSFDDDTEFFEESRPQKLWRKIKQEPLIPLGCLATCYALYQASKSIRQGNPVQTNKMFRARIYAQGFTLVAIVAGSIFYKDERMKRKVYEKKVEEKKQTEKREKWLRELEARDKEDREWRQRIEQQHGNMEEIAAESRQSLEKGKKKVQDVDQSVRKIAEKQFSSKSMKEGVNYNGWGPGTWVLRTSDAWRRI